MRLKLSDDGEGGLLATSIPRECGVPQTIGSTDALFALPLDQTAVAAGEGVEVELLRPLEVIRASWEA